MNISDITKRSTNGHFQSSRPSVFITKGFIKIKKNTSSPQGGRLQHFFNTLSDLDLHHESF